jgi:hypothetical protein
LGEWQNEEDWRRWWRERERVIKGGVRCGSRRKRDKKQAAAVGEKKYGMSCCSKML